MWDSTGGPRLEEIETPCLVRSQGQYGRLGAQVVQVELPYLIANLNERHIEVVSVLCQKIRIIGQLVLFL